MKRVTYLLLALAFAGVILLPVNAAVNNHSSEKTMIADGGSPLPPPPPCAVDPTGGILQA
jgi:hypothetical protein